jgi:hypothetical protein
MPAAPFLSGSVTGYKKFDPAVAGGVEGKLYWMVVRERSGGVLLGSVRFKEEFKGQKLEAGDYVGKQFPPAHPVKPCSS